MLVTEVLGHRDASREADTEADARRLVHLAEHEGGLGQHGRRDFAGAHHGFAHFDEEVVPLTGALPHTGEHRHTAVVRWRHGVIISWMTHGLADTGAAEHADLAALHL